MTQHGEQLAVVPATRSRVKRSLRSAATFALTAGLALTVAAAATLPLGSSPHGALTAAAETASASAHAISTAPPISGRPARPHRPVEPGFVASAPTPKDSATGNATFGSGPGAKTTGASVAALGQLVPTASARLLAIGTRASRTRGQPDQA